MEHRTRELRKQDRVLGGFSSDDYIAQRMMATARDGTLVPIRPTPEGATPDPSLLADTAPKEWWRYDVLDKEGATKFREIVDDVKAACSGLELEM